MNAQWIDGIADVFFVLDTTGHFTSLNRAAEQFFGQPRQHLIGRCLWEDCPHLTNSDLEQGICQAQQQPSPTRLEVYLDHNQRWYEAQLTPCGEGLAVCLQDISTRRRIEATLLERSQLAQLEAQVSHALVQKSASRDGLEHCSQLLVNELDAAAIALWTHNSLANHLELQASALAPAFETPSLLPLFPQADLLRQRTVSLEEPLLQPTLRSQQPHCQHLTLTHRSPSSPLERPAESDFYCDLTLPQLEARGLWLATYPLTIEERLIGVLGVWLLHLPSATIEETLATIADNLAVAIDRTWARTALQSRREALLFRLANQIRDSLDLDTILDTAVREIRNLLHVDWCSYLWCWQQGEQASLTVSHQAYDPSLQPPDLGNYPPQSLALLTEAIVEQRPLRIDDLGAARLGRDRGDAKTQAWRELLTELDLHALLVLPLKTRSQHLGAIFCASRRRSRYWSENDLELLQAVVDQLSLAIDQAELFAQTRATALAAQTQAQQLQSTLEELRRTQSQLIQTEKMSSLGQMIAGIAHEINNPVNFISGNLSYTGEYVDAVLKLIHLYQQRYPSPAPDIEALATEIDIDFILEDLPKTLASMQIGAERIRQIVLSLRNFSRLDQAEMKPVDIHEGIDSTLLILHNRLKAKAERPEVQIQRHYGNLPLVECYAGQLNQVFMNIISNAADAFTGQPEPHQIAITTKFDPDPEPPDDERPYGMVYICIRDNGAGMDEATRKRIFDPFFTTKPVGKGTGLGLSISYQIIVEKHRGQLDCHSTLGEGTEFVIAIPAVPPPELRPH